MNQFNQAEAGAAARPPEVTTFGELLATAEQLGTNTGDRQVIDYVIAAQDPPSPQT